MKKIFWIGWMILSLSSCGVNDMKKEKEFDMRGMTQKALEAVVDVRWVDIEELKKTLEGRPPMNVGFDIDDTVYYSSPSIRYAMGQTLRSDAFRDIMGTMEQEGKTSEKKRGHILPEHMMKIYKMEEFWKLLDKSHGYSIPKETTAKVIRMHLDRGDDVYFITGRMKSGTDNLFKDIVGTYGSDNIHPVIFAGEAYRKAIDSDETGKKHGKTQLLINHNIEIFYGDADDDILSAQEADIRAIRILKAANSIDQKAPSKPGKYQEEILRNSQY